MNQKASAAYEAAEYVKDGMTVGLGTGSTVFYLVKRVGQMVADGLRIRAVSTSDQTTQLAQSLNIPLLSINSIDQLDVCIDGVDEVDGLFNGIKGGGGALFREKIVSSRAKTNIWIMDETKLVDKLGAFRLPVEVLPFGYVHVCNKLKSDGFDVVLRETNGKVFETNNHNYILDVRVNDTMTHEHMSKYLYDIVGIVEHGYFLNCTDVLVVGTDSGAKIIQNPNKSR